MKNNKAGSFLAQDNVNYMSMGEGRLRNIYDIKILE